MKSAPADQQRQQRQRGQPRRTPWRPRQGGGLILPVMVNSAVIAG